MVPVLLVVLFGVPEVYTLRSPHNSMGHVCKGGRHATRWNRQSDVDDPNTRNGQRQHYPCKLSQRQAETESSGARGARGEEQEQWDTMGEERDVSSGTREQWDTREGERGERSEMRRVGCESSGVRDEWDMRGDERGEECVVQSLEGRRFINCPE